MVEQLAEDRVARWLNVELPSTQMRRVDLLAELSSGELFHLELQSRSDGRIAERMLEYRLLIKRAHGKVPRQMVLYVGPDPLSMEGLLQEDGLRFECHIVDIRDIDPGPLLASPAVEDHILSILCAVRNAKEAALEVLHEISLLPHPARGDALAKLLVLSGLRRLHGEIRQEIQQMPLFDHPLENPFLYDLFMEGKAEGKTEGKAEARVEEAVRFVTQILEHRFGPLPEWAKEKVRSLPADQLERMVDQALDATDLQSALA